MQSEQTRDAAKQSDPWCLLAEKIPHLVWIRRPDGSIYYCNQRWYAYTQAISADVLGDHWLHFYHPDDQQSVQNLWHTALQSGQPYEAEVRLRDGQTGAYRWFLERGLPFPDPQGRIVWWLMTATDSEQHKRTEDALQKMQDVFYILTDTLPQLVWIGQADGDHDYANQRWYDYTGSTPEQVVGKRWVSYYHPDDQAALLDGCYQAIRTSQPFEVEVRLREGKTGAYRWFLMRGVPLLDASGHVRKWLGTNTDIDAHKRREEALRESEVQLRRLMQSNIIGIIVSGLEGTIYEANDAFLSLVGYTRQDLAAGHLRWTEMTPLDLQARDVEAIEEAFATGSFTPYEKEYLTKNGKRVPVLVGGSLLRQESAELMEICFVLERRVCEDKE